MKKKKKKNWSFKKEPKETLIFFLSYQLTFTARIGHVRHLRTYGQPNLQEDECPKLIFLLFMTVEWCKYYCNMLWLVSSWWSTTSLGWNATGELDINIRLCIICVEGEGEGAFQYKEFLRADVCKYRPRVGIIKFWKIPKKCCRLT